MRAAPPSAGRMADLLPEAPAGHFSKRIGGQMKKQRMISFVRILKNFFKKGEF
jgi:hypothetical protein